MTKPESGREPSEMVVTLVLHRRPDGGLRVHSPTLPGLALSCLDEEAVLQDIGPAIKGLLEHQGRWPTDAALGVKQAEGEQ